jgi:hypothetical protein
MKLKIDRHQARALAELISGAVPSENELAAMLQIYTLWPLIDRLRAASLNLRTDSQKAKIKLTEPEIVALHFTLEIDISSPDAYFMAYLTGLAAEVDAEYLALKNAIYAKSNG